MKELNFCIALIFAKSERWFNENFTQQLTKPSPIETEVEKKKKRGIIPKIVNDSTIKSVDSKYLHLSTFIFHAYEKLMKRKIKAKNN